MSLRLRGALVATPGLLVGALVLGACGSTYINTAATTAPPTVPTTLPAIPADAPLSELFTQLDSLMRGLDELIVNDEGDDAALERIEAVWDAAEPQIRESNPDDLFPFEQALTLARTGVERRRPADASKGYKLLVTAVNEYDLTTG